MSDNLMNELRARLREVDDLARAGAVLEWDQRTYMPVGGGEARGRQLSTLSKLIHERATDPKLGELLENLREYEEGLPFESDDASMIRVTRRHYEHSTRLPGDFVERMTRHFSATYNAWHEARPANDFARVRQLLQETVEISREYASYFPGASHPADPLMNPMNLGLNTAELSALFATLRAGLVPLARAISEAPQLDDAPLLRHFPRAEQLAFGEKMSAAFGCDFTRGRQDITAHPFMITFSAGDVRITTRVNERDLGDCLFSTLHESGHAIYEQGIPAAYDATSLFNGATGDVHESQSRLWENLVGRSRECWEHWYPLLKAAFPAQLGDVTMEQFYRAINIVRPSLIRTESDEVTYNLHVMVRFELELALLDGSLSVDDLPTAWRDRYAEYLGVVPPDDRDGVLQDVHWFSGPVGGAFHVYTVGNVLGAQFFARAKADHPEIPAEITRGHYTALRNWLTENIYRHGAKFTLPELVERVTGGPVAVEPYLQYLRGKFGELYGIG